MTVDSTGDKVNDEIIRLFLYGNKDGLSNYLSESVIRPDVVSEPYKLDPVDYMALGPGSGWSTTSFCPCRNGWTMTPRFGR
jgi:hypothetical protein